MVSLPRSELVEFLSPLLKQPCVLQVGALCYRYRKGALEILLITSSSGNWILPKGWPVKGLDGRDSALREAWEEAGVEAGKSERAPVFSVNTVKRFDSGAIVPCQLDIYKVKVTKLRDEYPEANRRKRVWVSPEKVIAMLADPAVAKVVEQFAKNDP